MARARLRGDQRARTDDRRRGRARRCQIANVLRAASVHSTGPGLSVSGSLSLSGARGKGRGDRGRSRERATLRRDVSALLTRRAR